MHRLLKTRFVDRWLWLCPALSLMLAAVVLLLFGFTFWGALLAALLLVCPAMLLGGRFWCCATSAASARPGRKTQATEPEMDKQHVFSLCYVVNAFGIKGESKGPGSFVHTISAKYAAGLRQDGCDCGVACAHTTK